MATRTTGIERHPDIVALRAHYDEAVETPTAQIIDGLAFTTAVFVAASPWIVGFSDLGTLTVNNLITGIAMAVLALSFASAYGRIHGIAWVAPLLGAWIVVAPWVVSGAVDTTRTITTNVIAGGLFLLLSLAGIGLAMRRVRR